MSKTSEAIRKFIGRFRDSVNAAPVDAAQEKQPTPIIKYQVPAAKPQGKKTDMVFGKRQAAPQLNKNGRVITH